MDRKSILEFLDQQSLADSAVEMSSPERIETFAQDDLICPHCGHPHDPDILVPATRTSGWMKCGDCGQGFSFEAVKRVVYTTYPE